MPCAFDSADRFSLPTYHGTEAVCEASEVFIENCTGRFPALAQRRLEGPVPRLNQGSSGRDRLDYFAPAVLLPGSFRMSRRPADA